MLQQRRSFTIKTRKKEEMKEQFVKNRLSGDFLNTSSTSDGLIHTNIDTLDPVVGGSEIQYNLRPLLRNIYLNTEKMEDALMDTERRSRARKTRDRDVRITDFGLIDRATQHSIRNYYSLQQNTR